MEKIGYVSIEEANAFIASHFLSSSKERIDWENLTDDDKSVLLINGLEDIENNNFYGYKTEPTQALSFPRNGSDIVPDDIKFAQIYEAVEIGFGDNTSYDAIEKGIASESIGKISTSYFSNAYYEFKNSTIKSSKAKKLLNNYIQNIFSMS